MVVKIVSVGVAVALLSSTAVVHRAPRPAEVRLGGQVDAAPLRPHRAPRVMHVSRIDLQVGESRIEGDGYRRVERQSYGFQTTCYWSLSGASGAPSGPMRSQRNYALGRATANRPKVPTAAYVVAGSARNGGSSSTTTRTARALNFEDFSISSRTRGSTSMRAYLGVFYQGRAYVASNPGFYDQGSAYAGLSVVARIRDLSVSRTVGTRALAARSVEARDGHHTVRNFTSPSGRLRSVAGYIEKGRRHRLEVVTTARAKATSNLTAGARAQIDFGGRSIWYPNRYPDGRVRPSGTVRVVFTNTYGRVSC